MIKIDQSFDKVRHGIGAAIVLTFLAQISLSPPISVSLKNHLSTLVIALILTPDCERTYVGHGTSFADGLEEETSFFGLSHG